MKGGQRKKKVLPMRKGNGDPFTATHLPAVQERRIGSLGWEDPWRRECSPLQYSCLESSMDRAAWQAAVHGVTSSHT